MLISSRQNPTVKRLLELRDAKGRKEQKRFLIDTPRDIERALSKKVEIIAAYVCSEFPTEKNILDELKRQKTEIIEVTKTAFEAICYRENPGGIILEAKSWETGLRSLILKTKAPTLVILAEDIEKPGNLGTLLRTADAVGADAVIGCNTTVEIFNPNTLRASAGAAFNVPYATGSRSEALAWISERKLELVATSPSAEKLPWESDLKTPLALAIGSEDKGLSEELLKAARKTLRLPMHGIGDSLNVSVATGAILYEILRQRGASGK